jgi:hypothetical protein
VHPAVGSRPGGDWVAVANVVAVPLVVNVAKPLVWLLAAVESGLASRCRVAAGWPRADEDRSKA